MKDAKIKVYVETSIISYLTAKPCNDIIAMARRKLTKEWWNNCSDRFDLFSSQLVIQEAQRGDLAAARKRIRLLDEIPLVGIDENARTLAGEFLASMVLPTKASEDALHIAIAVCNELEYLLTWNCKHLANATLRRKVDDVCRSMGYNSVQICTPEELTEAF